jgi:putative flippase GtrA
MLKRALKFAIGPSVGITLGGIIIPRIMFPNLYNETYPPILLQAGIYFVVGYIVSFLVSLLIEWIKLKAESKQ